MAVDAALPEHHGFLKVGQLVQVKPRTWAGINRPGGAALVTAIEYDGEGDGGIQSVDVKYVVGSATDKRLELNLIEPFQELKRGRRSRRGRDFLDPTAVKAGNAENVATGTENNVVDLKVEKKKKKQKVRQLQKTTPRLDSTTHKKKPGATAQHVPTSEVAEVRVPMVVTVDPHIDVSPLDTAAAAESTVSLPAFSTHAIPGPHEPVAACRRVNFDQNHDRKSRQKLSKIENQDRKTKNKVLAYASQAQHTSKALNRFGVPKSSYARSTKDTRVERGVLEEPGLRVSWEKVRKKDEKRVSSFVTGLRGARPTDQIDTESQKQKQPSTKGLDSIDGQGAGPAAFAGAIQQRGILEPPSRFNEFLGFFRVLRDRADGSLEIKQFLRDFNDLAGDAFSSEEIDLHLTTLCDKEIAVKDGGFLYPV